MKGYTFSEAEKQDIKCKYCGKQSDNILLAYGKQNICIACSIVKLTESFNKPSPLYQLLKREEIKEE